MAQVETSLYPEKMEELGQTTGYLLYETDLELDAEEEKLRIIDGRDRVQIYLDDQHVATQYQTEIVRSFTKEKRKRFEFKNLA